MFIHDNDNVSLVCNLILYISVSFRAVNVKLHSVNIMLCLSHQLHILYLSKIHNDHNDMIISVNMLTIQYHT